MERPLRRKAEEGTKFDFRLHFHASRVPTSGWDKLVVSVLSIETGRITVKTSRGVVRNGSCQWPDPVVESTKLFQNPSTGECNDKVYKLYVQMGSLRAGILGEATINFAEYVAAESPEAVSLPLRNCSSGTILHVKIQCLTPTTSIRDLEGQRISMLDQECPGSVSEDNSSSSDMSENPTSGSVGSSASQNVAALLFVPASQGHHRDGLPSIAASQPAYDVIDHSSDKSASPAFFKGYVSAEMQSFGPENHVLFRPFSTAAEFMNAKLSPPVKDYGAWVAAGLPQKLEAAEATIQELREESLVWERQARKLAVEVETFRQKLAYESKIGSELKMKLSAAEAECDSLKSEVEQVKASKVTPKTRGGHDNFSRMEDSRRMIKLLQEEIQYEKEVNANLQMQLNKTQDSNANLLSTLTELEEILEASNKVVEKLTEANKKLEKDLSDAHRKLEIIKTSGDAEVQGMEHGEWKHSSSTLEAMAGKKEQKTKWFGSQVEELQSARQLNAKDERAIKFEAVLEESNNLDSLFMPRIDESEDTVHALEKDREVLLQKIENETDLRSQLEAEVVQLGMEIDKLVLDIVARDTSIENLNCQLAELEAERAALDGRLQSLLEERQIFSSVRDAEKASVLEKLEEAHFENSRHTQRLEELVAELERLRNVLDSCASENRMLESKRTELLVIQGELQARICDLEEANAGLFEKLSSLERQLSSTSEDEAHLRHIIETSKDESLANENQINRLQTHQTRLEQELQDATDMCATMQDKLASLETQMQQQRQDSNNREHSLRLEIDSILSCKKSLEQAAKNGEEALIAAEQDKSTSLEFLQRRLEQLSLIVDKKENAASQAMARIEDLQAEKADLQNSLGIMEEKVKNLEQLSMSLTGLDIKLRDALIELDASNFLCNDLTQKLQEKECVLHEQLIHQEKQEKDFQKKNLLLESSSLEKDNMHLVICEDEAILKENNDRGELNAVLELQERLHCLQGEIKASEEGLIACKKDFLQRETELMSKIEYLELFNEQLTAGLIDSGADQLQKELIRLQNQNSFLSRKEQELLSQMHTQEVLQEEVKRLQEANDLLEARLSKFVETAKNPFLLEKIVSLETELAEAIEANNIYKLQLKSVIDKQQLGDLDQAIEDLCQHKKRATQLQDELDNMHERYTLISLKLAEAEAERGELVITLKNLKGINKK
ncbi:hypothetical protein GOP47_0005558 [Adiantum capillus-veneris]|uniref:C2 NT-type domain-containing protein n=1 Tax=Adiantum capillus-veneris TaxID=13818 RepID=A0A9D4ZLP5_ADICA|nr:hypothetical protein GOP47_0005558 [Adiantum capillus-veneris]